MTITTQLALLNNLSPIEFMRKHWQKKPLFVSSSIPNAATFIDRNTLFELASHEGVESRLVIYTKRKWDVQYGPFSKPFLRKLPKKNWTLLVQGVNLHLQKASDLLNSFAFLPYARLDDLMVSYAAPGGGVGPHFDSYDVFLLQGEGCRQWQISNQSDLSLVPDAPLKILRRFKPQQEWSVNPGDLLYLPPHYAHQGTAITHCMTYSIGFRSPSAQDLTHRFFNFLQDRVETSEQYADPELRATRHPALIPTTLQSSFLNILKNNTRWRQQDILQFIGEDLSTPKDHITFELPSPALSKINFLKLVRKYGMRLTLTSILLYDNMAFYINGERHHSPPSKNKTLLTLADHRKLPPSNIEPFSANILYQWYRCGYLQIDQ